MPTVPTQLPTERQFDGTRPGARLDQRRPSASPNVEGTRPGDASARAEVAIVGAGAAGLATAIFAAEAAAAPRRIVLLDSARKIGAKILVSGGGRCNVTHDAVEPADFNGPRTIVRNVLAAFDERATVAWFERLGVRLKREETGKLFPVSNDAKTVLRALVGRAEELGVELRTGCRVREVLATGDGFSVVSSNREPRRTLAAPGSGVSDGSDAAEEVVVARRVVLATGGRSLPKTGSDGHGYAIARALGHSVTPTFPALVPLVLDDGFFHRPLAGLSLPAELSTFADAKLADRRSGSLLWTHFGVSGPVVMDASRHWIGARAEGRRAELVASFRPGESFEAAEARFVAAAASRPRLSLGGFLATLVPERLGGALLAHAGLDATVPLARLSRDARRSAVHVLTALRLPVVRDRGWNFAEVTAGGVPLREVDFRTMESRRTPGLHLVGEILDCDGRIGGFNFQWAWSTAWLTARALTAQRRT